MELTTQSRSPVNEVQTYLLVTENKIQEVTRVQCLDPEKDDANISWMTTVLFIILSEVMSFFVKLFR
jgi:hypothetical protein